MNLYEDYRRARARDHRPAWVNGVTQDGGVSPAPS
jgi:hypothetical protein